MSLSQYASAGLWRLRRWSRMPAFGPTLWALAVLALTLAAFLNWRAGVALRAQEQASQQSRAMASATRPALEDPRQLVQQFVDALPPQEDAPKALQTLFDLADSHGLQLLRGSYRFEAEPKARLARWRMSFPVRGDPAPVQGFIQAALLALPTLAVESLQFKHEPGAPLEARIQWVLFVRDHGPASAARVALREVGS